ncbi:MAG: UbiX family flavin prenyltransferase [Rhodanobacter lindaniclasticus]|jgi:4-hydroxy-3-polyprenylbenzoate decarboxylase
MRNEPNPSPVALLSAASGRAIHPQSSARVPPMTTARRFRLIVGISGATGIALGVRALELARAAGAETHLVVTRPADRTRAYETDLTARQLRALADFTHAIDNIGAAIASGSFEIDAMLVAPCSAHTLSAIACGTGDNLLTRAADVTLKERRRLVLLARETPLTLAHLRAMTAVTEMGGVVMPPLPAFYLRPQSVDDIVTHTAARALDFLGVKVADLARWQGDPALPKTADHRALVPDRPGTTTARTADAGRAGSTNPHPEVS